MHDVDEAGNPDSEVTEMIESLMRVFQTGDPRRGLMARVASKLNRQAYEISRLQAGLTGETETTT